MVGWRASRGPERSVGLPVAAAGAMALTVTWALGLTWATVALDAAMTVTWAAAWMAYGPLVRRWEAAARPPLVTTPPVLRNWGEHMVALGLPGTVARVVTETADMVHLEVRLPSGRAPRDLGAKIEHLEGALSRDLEPVRLRPGSVRMERDVGRAHVVHLYVELRDPLAVRRPLPQPTAMTAAEPVTVGFDRDGGPVAVTVTGRHVMLAGRTGSGKTRALVAMVLDLARPDTLLLGVDDVDRGANLGPVESVFHRLARTHEEAAELVAGVLRAREARVDWLAARGLQEWPISPERPRIVLAIEELTGVIRALGGVEPLNAIVAEGRKAGIVLLGSTQRMQAEALGDSTGLASQCHVLLCLRVSKKEEAVAVFGSDRVADGWWPHRLAETGEMLAWSDGERVRPTPVGTYWLTTDEAVRIAKARASHMPEPDPETAAALAPRAKAPALVVANETAEELLDRLLADAGWEGARFGDLVEAVSALPSERRRSRAWVASWLDSHAEKAGHGRWRKPAEGGSA